jgi:hypothetical protein
MPKSTANVSEKTKQAINEDFLNYVSSWYNYYGYSIHTFICIYSVSIIRFT